MIKQLEDISDIETVVIQPVNLSMVAIKELSAKWLVGMSEYIADNCEWLALNGEEPAEIMGMR